MVTSKNIEFRVTQDRDARAIQSRKLKICILPQQDVEVLGSSNKEDIDSERISSSLAKISHELSHLVSNDAALFSVFTLSWLAGLGLSISVWILFVSYGAPFRISGLSALAMTGLFFLSAGYNAIRLREFYADRLAAYLQPDNMIDGFLSKNTRREKFLKFPFTYRMTHPASAERLTVFRDFRSVYQLRVVDMLIFSLTYAFLYSIAPFAYYAARDRIGVVTAATVGVVGIITPMWFIFVNIAPGALVRAIDVKQMLKLLAVSAIVSPLFLYLVLFSVAGSRIAGIPFATSEFAMASFLAIPTFTFSLWYLSGDVGRFRGPKKLNRLFFLILFIASAVFFAYAIFGLRSISKLLTNYSLLSGDDRLELLIFIAGSLSIMLLVRTTWFIYVRQVSRKWSSGEALRTRFEFIEHEWSPKVAMRTPHRMGCLPRILIFIFAYIYGLLLFAELYPLMSKDSLFRDPRIDSMRASEDLASLIVMWTIIFVVNAISLSIVARRARTPTISLSWNQSDATRSLS
jgi:hypothetical protein